MKKILSILIVVMACHSTVLAGTNPILDAAEKAIALGGGVNSGAEVAQKFSDDPRLKDIEQQTRALGLVSDVKDLAAVGGAGATVAGASGSGIMSTMAATGAAIGSGVVAGSVVTAGMGGLGAASLMNKYVFDGNSEADEAACYGTYAGVGVGTAASVGALTAAGAGPAGLAAIGATVGGGMAAGAVAVLAAPVVAATVVGGTVYWLFK